MRVGTEQRGGGTKILKRGVKQGQGVGALKRRGAGTPLRTMHFYDWPQIFQLQTLSTNIPPILPYKNTYFSYSFTRLNNKHHLHNFSSLSPDNI